MDRNAILDKIAAVRGLLAKADAELGSANEHVTLEQDRLALACVEIAGSLIDKAKTGSYVSTAPSLHTIGAALKTEIEAGPVAKAGAA